MKIRSFLFLIPVIAISFFFTYLFYLESFNYDNYIFSTFNFNLARFAIIPGIAWAVWAILFLWKKKLKWATMFLVVMFCLISVPPALQGLGLVFARTHQIFLGKGYVTQKSLNKLYGNDYKFMDFIKNYLSKKEYVTIIVPPDQLPWRHTGNTQIMNSYLYPIKTTNSMTYVTPYMLISSEEDGASYHLWPDFEVPAKEIIIYNWSEEEPTIIKDKNWNPEEWEDKKPWGLIIKKDE